MQILVDENRIVVDGVNIAYKHMKSRRTGESGQKIQFFAPVNISNVQLICAKCKQATRIAIQTSNDKKKVRVCKKCNEVID